MRLGRVTQSAPLRVRLNGDTNAAAAVGPPLPVGSEVVVDTVESRRFVVHHTAALIGAMVYAGAVTPLASATPAAVAMNSEVFDTHGFHDNAVNNSRLTIPAGMGGYYDVLAHINIAANAAGLRSLQLRKNGSIITAVNSQPSPAAGWADEVSMPMVLAAAGDYFEAWGRQDSGGSLDTVVGATNTWLALRWCAAA